jgi:hypothetical protein
MKVSTVGPPRDNNVPSLSRQKSFIIENTEILDRDTKLTILRLIMLEIGPSALGSARAVILEHGATREISINLDNVDNEEVILQIYNIVSIRRASLNEPRTTGKL